MSLRTFGFNKLLKLGCFSNSEQYITSATVRRHEHCAIFKTFKISHAQLIKQIKTMRYSKDIMI